MRVSVACAPRCRAWAPQHVRWLDTAAGMARRPRCGAPCCRCSWARPAPSGRRPSSRIRRWRPSASRTSSPSSSGSSGARPARLVRGPRLGGVPAHPAAARPQDGGRGRRRLGALAGEVAALVAAYHGVISGEHGCGRSRSWLLPAVLGAELYGAMVAVKDAFDPSSACWARGRGGQRARHRGAALRRRLSRRPRLDAAALVHGPRAASSGHREVLRRGPLQEARRHHVPAGLPWAARGAQHPGARQRPAGHGLRRRARSIRHRATTSSARCWAPASPARPARRSAPRAWTWLRSRRSGSPSCMPAPACRLWPEASASSAGWRPWRHPSLPR